jgi:hypothetical protein
LESIGVYTNDDLLKIASVVLKAQFEQCKSITEAEESLTTMQDCFDVKITGDYHLNELEVHVEGDYSIGKMLEAEIFKKFHDATTPITFVAFFKKHPHDKFGILRVAFEGATAKSTIELVKEACDGCIGILQKLNL